jgi:hypothetical protein
MQKHYESDLIRPEIEHQRKRYQIDPNINILSDKESINESIKFELIPSWFDPLFPRLVFYGKNQ